VREGLLQTQPLASSGTRLSVNAACDPGGYVKVEVTDVNDAPMPGRTRDDCDAFTGDAVVHTVTWRGDPSVPMPDTPTPRFRTPYRKLRFILRAARVYGFRLHDGLHR